MRAIYFRHNFALAYSRNSRAQITLRLSTYTSKSCCSISVDDFGNVEYGTIGEYVDKFLSNNLQNKHSGNKTITKNEMSEMKKSSMNCDSTITSVYSYFKESRVIEHGYHTRSTVATLAPVKINWLNIDNSPTSLVQYIFNYDDFRKDTRYHKGLSSLNADKKVLEKFYCQELNEDTELSTIKSVYTDMTLSQNRRNLCMSYANNIQTLEEFLNVHIGFGSIYQKRLQVVTSGVKDSVNPHTGEIYFRKMKTVTKSPYKAIIDDATLIYSVLTHGYKLARKDVRIVLNSLELKDPNSIEGHICLFSEILDKSISELKSLGFNQSELKMFSFLKAFMTNDVKDLSELVNENMMYSYQYVRVPNDLNHIFSESVKFDYQGQKFQGFRFKNSSQIIVLTENRHKALLTDAYLITQKLFNIITQSSMEKMISQTQLRSMMVNDTIKSMDEMLEEEDFSLVMSVLKPMTSLSMEGEREFYSFKDINLSRNRRHIFLQVEEIDVISNTLTEPINKSITIDWEQSSVYVGSKKLFTLPVLGCTQSNTSRLAEDFNVNGLTVNWWLQESRLRHFTHNEDIPVTRETYGDIGGFLLKNDKFTFSISAIHKIEKINKLPNVKSFLSKYNLADVLKERITNKNFNNENPPPQFEEINDNDPTIGGGSYTKSINWSEKMKGLSMPTFDFDVSSDEEEIPAEDMFGQLPKDFMSRLLDDEEDVDMDKFMPIQEIEDSDNDDFEIEHIKDISSGSSENSDEQYLKFTEFQNMIPKIETSDTVFLSGKSHSTSKIKKLGDPTHYIIKKGYADRSSIASTKSKDRVAMLYKLKAILSLSDYINDYELLLSITLLNDIVESFSSRQEWNLKEDFMFYEDENGDYDIYLKFIGDIPESSQRNIKSKGGHIKVMEGKNKAKEMYALIPIPESRKRDMLESFADESDIYKFLNVKPLELCYYRLFKEPFRRIGFASQLLAEFF
jgi:hypothetical protein